MVWTLLQDTQSSHVRQIQLAFSDVSLGTFPLQPFFSPIMTTVRNLCVCITEGHVVRSGPNP